MLESHLALKPSRRIWMMGSVVATGLHLGFAAMAFAHLRSDELDTSLGAQALEVGLEMTSPRTEATDLPPGPDSDASTASPAIAEQQAVVKETDLPQAVPDETEDPDRIVTENESKKPTEEETEKAAVAASASTEFGRSRGHGHADQRSRAGSAALGSSVAGQRRKRRAGSRDLAEGTDGAPRQAQTLSFAPVGQDHRNRRRLRPRSGRSRAFDDHRQGVG